MWFFHNPGLLGINARNLLYIKAYNPKKAIKIADSKLKTKSYLSARGIPVAKFYASIASKKELENFDWSQLPSSFVIKPNAGYGGEGILIIRGKKGINWIKNNGELISQIELVQHVNDILDGRYSLANISDTAFFEQRLEAPNPFKKMSYKGLPDIRIVVHNLIPVMAMMRLSTVESQGKANVHMGGIAVGIDLAKGEMTYITQYNKRIDSVPGFGDVNGIKIPDWDEILLIASRVQQVTNLGFAAIDITLDKNGPVILEINARAGLNVQIANMAPLRKRLERIEGVKVNSAEKGVRIAQELFGKKIEKRNFNLKKPIIGQYEQVELITNNGTKKVIAHIDIHQENTLLNSNLAEEIGFDGKLIKFNLAGNRIMSPAKVSDELQANYPISIGKKDLKGFLIDPNKTIVVEAKNSKKEAPKIIRQFTKEELIKIDTEIIEIDRVIKLLSHLKPTNLLEEHQKFLENPEYNPQFKYKSLNFDPKNLYTRLKRIEYPNLPIGILWKKKANEIERKIALLETRGQELFLEKSIDLYGKPNAKLVKKATKLIEKMPSEFPKEKGEILSIKEAKQLFEKAIKDYGLKGWSVLIKKEMVSDAIAGKSNTIMLREGAQFTSERIKGTIAHEIETHAFTAMNGSRQPYKIFQRGLADYLLTEEGLAVYNQEKANPGDGEKKYWAASSVIGIHTAITGSFSDIYRKIVSLGFSTSRAWTVAIKTKRGLEDTSKPGAFTKDLVYFKGHQMILDFIKEGGNLMDLYYGKTNLEDLEIIKQIKELKDPIFLPEHLQN